MHVVSILRMTLKKSLPEPPHPKRRAIIASLRAGNSTAMTATALQIGRKFVQAIRREVLGKEIPASSATNSNAIIQRAKKKRSDERYQKLELLSRNNGHGRASEALAKVQKNDGCRWPFGTPDKEDFKFCGKVREPQKPYCQKCMRKAYLTPRI